MEFASSLSAHRVVVAQLGVVLTSLLLASCGGGGGGGNSPPPPPAAALSYPSPQVYVVQVPITPLRPSINVAGGLSGFNSFPGLPPGLVLDSTTGVISGTPTYAGGGDTYNISATGSDGKSASAQIMITVKAVAANVVSYGSPRFTFTAGVRARTLTPVTAVGVTAWSISPQLPAGLIFNNGSILGTPTAASPPAVYTVTAQTSSGPLSVNLAIDVETDVLLDVGHNAGVAVLGFNGSSVLSADDNGHWVLWNYATAAIIASGDSDCLFNACPKPSVPLPMAAIGGPTAVVETRGGFQVLAAATGAVTASITSPVSWWLLAPDGSYLVAGSTSGLNAWSPSGQLLASRSGDYSSAAGVALPGAIHIAMGPAGANVIETLSVPGGADSVSPAFNGQFSSWFLDGSAFFSTAGSTLLIYSNAVVQEAAFALPTTTPTGSAQWLWSFTNGRLTFYALSAPTTPVVSYTGVGLVAVSGSTIGVNSGSANGFSVIDLSGASPVKTDYTTPFGNNAIGTYAAASASKWVIGYGNGLLIDGASLSGSPRFFGYGEVLSIAGSQNQIAVSTALGKILYFDTTTLAQEGTISFASGQLALSSDGSVLAAAPNQSSSPGFASQSLNIYSMPSASLLHSWPYPFLSNVSVGSVALSGSGSVLAQVLTNGTLLVSAPTGGAPIDTTTAWTGQLSPDGTLIATSTTGNPGYTGPPFPTIGTNIVKNGALVTAVLGWPVGWIDNGDLLVNSYQPDYFDDTITDYIGCSIYDSTGKKTGATCNLPDVLGFQTVASDTLYALNLNAIVSVSTGAVSWMSGDPVARSPNSYSLLPLDTLAGSHVVFVSGSRVVAQSY